MKCFKNLWIYFVLAAAMLASAAEVWLEDFEGAFPAAGWESVSVDLSETYAQSGSISVKLGATGDRLQTPQLANGVSLSFWTYSTASDPSIVVEYATDPTGTWTEFPESPFSGDTGQWTERVVDLASLGAVYVRIRKSGTGTLYVDDIALFDDGPEARSTPEFGSLEAQAVLVGQSLRFQVVAADSDGDEVTQQAVDLPVGASFDEGLFDWPVAVPVGVYTVSFIATDVDGSSTGTVSIAVQALPLLMISEIADPAGVGGDAGRFVELYNAGEAAIDLALDEWHLCRQANGGDSWSDVPLVGTLQPLKTHCIAKSADDFAAYYGMEPDQEAAGVDGNGDDAYFLYYGGDHESGMLVDAFGRPDEDGTETEWEYTDQQVTRLESIVEPNSSWNAAEWLFVADAEAGDMTPGVHGPRPVFREQSTIYLFPDEVLSVEMCASNAVRADFIALTALNLPDGASFTDVSGADAVQSTLAWSELPEGRHVLTFRATGLLGAREQTLTIVVSATARIAGSFYGWDPETIVKLSNGQFWKNIDGVGQNVELLKPVVEVSETYGSLRMAIEGVSGEQRVEKIDVEESALVGTFAGLKRDALYELADGTVWLQTSSHALTTEEISVTTWRWMEDGILQLRFFNRSGEELGTCSVVAGIAESHPAIESRIDGWFRGWQVDRVFALQNGQFWQQVDLSSAPATLGGPAVQIVYHEATGVWEMSVEGVSASVEVIQREEMMATAVDGFFYGLGVQTVYHLKNGSWWRQISLERSSVVRASPTVYIWERDGDHYLELPDDGRAVEVEPLEVLLVSDIVSAFIGLKAGNRYELEDGTEWFQESNERVSESCDEAVAVLWNEDGRVVLLVRSNLGKAIGNCFVARPEEDSDLDGVANYLEFIAGVDPYDAESQFVISSVSQTADGRSILCWNSIEWRSYVIEQAASLGDAFIPVATVVAPVDCWTNLETQAQGYYRLRVQLESD